MPDLSIRDIEFERAPAGMRGTGILGFARIRVGEIVLELVVRRTRDDRVIVTFPRRHSRSGQSFEVARPATHDSRRAIEREVLTALRARGDLP